ncbi:MAG TPA: hypothetical protein VJN43_05600 [Bryobacteraceae bacterium]|nr:hypothetical protein [Bryobacteraceae bacterium]
MLQSLDVLIGFAVIMLLASMAVTALTQLVTGALGWRGRNLLRGVVTILNQIDPKMMPFCTQQIARAVLRHPLIAHGMRLATVIQREELTRILLELAAGREPGGKSLDEVARAALKKAIESAGISDAAATLDNMHLFGLKLEALRPELGATLRNSVAAITEAPSQFVARIHACFDETMDRITHRFARHARVVTAFAAVAVAAGLQLDAFDLLKRLSTDAATRASLNALAENMKQSDSADATQIAAMQKLASSGYAIMPENWKREWNAAKIPGIALSAILLGLGAPFWYNALKDLVGLRPVLARKEQAHREQRQSVAEAAASPVPAPGEKGDVSAVAAG